MKTLSQYLDEASFKNTTRTNETKEISASEHKSRVDFVGHHIENTGKTHDQIRDAFLKKFGNTEQNHDHFKKIVSDMVD